MILELLTLCFHVPSYMAWAMDGHFSSGIDMEKYMLVEMDNFRYEQYKIVDSDSEEKNYITNVNQDWITHYNFISQTMKSSKESREQEKTRQPNEENGNVKNKMNGNEQGNNTNREKIDKVIKGVISDNFPTLNQPYHFSAPTALNEKERVGCDEHCVNEAVITRYSYEFLKYYSEYDNLLAMYGPNVRTYIKTADCMALMTQLAYLIGSEPTSDGVSNRFNEIMMVPELSDAHFTLVASRYIAFLSMQRNVNCMIGVQKKLVNRFPQDVGKLNKLWKMQYVAEHELDIQDVLEWGLELDMNDQIFIDPMICLVI